MALIVEDGSVVPGSESYLAVVDATAYHLNRGNAVWAALATDTIREQCLRKATDYMVQMYRSRWKGFRKDGTQLLDWPRSFVYLEPFVHGIVGTYPFLVSSTIVPLEVKNVCAELAVRVSVADLAPDLDRQAISKSVGPIRIDYDRSSQYYKQYRSLDALLAPYLNGSSSSVKLMRT